jgi:hypothetical protein
MVKATCRDSCLLKDESFSNDVFEFGYETLLGESKAIFVYLLSILA